MELKREKIDNCDQTDKGTKISFDRSTALISWFAVEKGKYGLVVDFLDKFEQKSDILLNILCYAKAKCGDPDGAIKNLSKSIQKSKRELKILSNSEIMDAINEEVNYLNS